MKSIAAKILIFIGGTMLIAILCVALITTSFVSTSAREDENYIMADENKKAAAYIENYFTKYINIAQQMSRDKNVIEMIRSDVNKDNYKKSSNFEDVYSMLKETAESDKSNILSVYIAKESTNLSFDNKDWVGGDDFNLKARDYWFKEKDSVKNGYIICEPYIDSDTKNMVTTVSAPIFDETRTNVIGVTAIDIKVTTICNMVTSAESTYDTGYQVLISKNGFILAHKDSNKLLKKYSEIGFDEIMQKEISKTSDQVIAFNDQNVKSNAVVGVEKNSGWKIVNIVPSVEYQETINTIIKTIVIVNGIAIILIACIIIVITGGISKPLTKLTKITDQLAKGDLDVTIDVHSKDEVGKLAASMGLLTSKLKTYIDYINEISNILKHIGNGELEVNFNHTYDGDFAIIKDALVNTTDMLNDTLLQINLASEQVASGSDQVSYAAQALSGGATEQASSIEELSATINDISAQIKQTAQNATKAKEISIEAKRTTTRGQQQMQEMVEAMEEISRTSNQIQKIIKNIDDIAFQTNILALNAAVEAARAGSAGKGFAVVADEVRSLASKSAESAKDTSELIQSALSAIEKGTVIVNETAKSLKEVVEDSEKSADIIQHIANASNEQAQSIVQINLGVEQISGVVQTNSATAEESAAASEELNAQAQLLNGLLSHFKLKEITEETNKTDKYVERNESIYD
ncbi:methyl-accepting chemotaxis protein [Paludicola sp. MB14-C6]|uniref:methyl-accepting chemotaxis protein n=1 Tax=Paludihabitans sp. MB14-C6 TaxID=3070656 RepID=UPI0027DE6EC6|nr:methyl-accepting chemotaxis protein [Paludicola sp. MB14-C6]WMJ22441.1 methyl-accepting chemotaxis protein [Paludicola sp. MB14-C6]